MNTLASFARSGRKHLKWAWLEHGTWATLWTAFGFGVVVGWPPSWVTASVLVGLSAVAAAKVLAVRVHRGQVHGWVVFGYLLAGGFGLVPLLIPAPAFVLTVGIPGALFLAVYFRAPCQDPSPGRDPDGAQRGCRAAGRARLAAVLTARPADWCVPPAGGPLVPGPELSLQRSSSVRPAFRLSQFRTVLNTRK